MKSPFYKVYLDGASKKDITDRIESFSFEDAIEEDNFLNLVVKSDFAIELIDDKELQTGQFISVQFGFLGSDKSPIHSARITDIVTSYAERVTLTLKCLDLGTNIKKVHSNRIWESMTSSAIAKEIAEKYGLLYEGVTTTKVWSHLPQANRNDLEFLRYLAMREAGHLTVYIRNGVLYFTNKKLGGQSVRHFIYQNDEAVISFKPTIKESTDSGAAVNVELALSDPTKSKSSKVAINDKNEEKTGTTGEYKRVYDADGNLKGTIKPNTSPNKTVVDPTKEHSEAVNIANNTKKKATLKQMVATLVVEGEANIAPNSIITMSNVARRHTGNWYVIKVTHAVSTSAFTTTLDLARNGYKTKIGAKATDANVSVGKDKTDAKSTVKVRKYDANGNYINSN